MSSIIFVNRTKELDILRRIYELCKKRVSCGVLIYGWRKIGKTTLVRKFLSEYPKQYLEINCAWINSPQMFFNKILASIRNFFGKEIYQKFLPYLAKINSELDYFFVGFEILDALSNHIDHPIIFLDEFPILVEKISSYVARKESRRGLEIKEQFYWFLKDIVERKNCMWIFASSLGWEKLAELMLMKRRKSEEIPLVGVLEKILVEPLSLEFSIELAIKLNTGLRYDEAKEIAEITGGIPKHIVSIALKHRAGESIISTIEKLLDLGEFDEVFESIIRALAEIAKRDYALFVATLKAIAEGNNTTETIARYVGLEKNQVYFILEELRKMELVKKIKKGKYVHYYLQYPLLGTWLLRRVEPISLDREKLLRMLGITTESYIREILRQIKQPITIWDDKKGTYLAGTTEKIEIYCSKVYDIRETNKFFGDIKNGDIVCEKENEYIIIEVKAKDKPILPEDIIKLDQVSKIIKKRKNTNIQAILIQAGYGEITPTAIAEAIKRKITIISREGLKLIAKKAGLPTI